MKPWMKITAGLTLALSVIGFIVIWDVKIKDQIDSIDVVVVKPGVEILEHEMITKEKLSVEKRRRTSIVEGVVLPHELEDVLGTTAIHHLAGNSLLSKRSLDFEGLKPNPYFGQAIRPIPNEWIYAKPSTLRRNDKISLYLFAPENTDGSADIQGLSPQQIEKLKELEEKQNEESEQYQEERENIAASNKTEVSNKEDTEKKIRKSIIDENIKDLSETELLAQIESGNIPLLVDIPIIYAKDGSGNEVRNGENSSEEERLTSTGTISDLELILTEDEYRFLKEYIEMGYKLYITYV